MSQDFTKNNTILITRNGVAYTSTGKRFELDFLKYDTDHPETLQDNEYLRNLIFKTWKNKPVFFIQKSSGYYYCEGYDIQLDKTMCPRTMRIQFYSGRVTRVAGYKEKSHLTRYHGGYGGDLFELRLYPDGSFLKIWLHKFGDRKNPFYFILNPRYQRSASDRYYPWFGTLYSDESTTTKINKVDANGNKWIIEVTEEQIHNNSLREYCQRNSRTNKLLFSTEFMGTDLRKGYITTVDTADRVTRTRHVKFHPDTVKLFHEFYRFDDTWNDEAMRLYAQYKRKTGRNEIESIYDVLDYTLGRNVYSSTFNEQKREERINDFKERMKSFPFFTGLSRKPVWTREGDYIICGIYHGKADSGWHIKTGEKAALFYNVKTKKRTLVVSDSNFRAVSILVPSAKEIFRHLDNRPKSSSTYDYDKHKWVKSYPHAMYCPKYLKPFDEIFAGTNIEFLKQNADPNQRIFNPECNEYCSDVYIGQNPYGRSSWKDYQVRYTTDTCTVGYQIDPSHLSLFALQILIGSAEPWLEQCIKCKLFNIYTTALGFPDAFPDVKKVEKDNRGYYSRSCYKIPVVRKATNLKKAFGLTVDQIRLIDKMIGEYQDKAEEVATRDYQKKLEMHPCDPDDINSHWSPEECIPVLVGAADSLGVALNKIDLKLFKEILELSVKKDRYDSNFDWKLSRYEYVLEALKNYGVKQRIEYIKQNHDLSSYNDYLRMREQLKDTAVKLNKPEIYNEKAYPIRPTGGIKFFRYRANQQLGYRTIRSEDDFISHYRYKFGDAYEKGRFQEFKDENGTFIGLLIELSADEVSHYLHDDISFWIDFYQDNSKQELFAKAVERVIPLEYEDKEDGLQIIAPRHVEELKEEGRTLSHCVASFVDPIINNTENVLFIRKTTSPGTPYFTLALDNEGNIEQVHCFHNGGVTEDEQLRAYTRSVQESNEMSVYKEPKNIIGFLKKWATAMKGKVKAASIKDSYGMLCARR
ncbi:MAG: PcfJ domain-containing protein [Prevotellaceae bacterium]|nr:PcfJ domain-containing protein [Candidatus Colivivens equi]